MSINWTIILENKEFKSCQIWTCSSKEATWLNLASLNFLKKVFSYDFSIFLTNWSKSFDIW